MIRYNLLNIPKVKQACLSVGKNWLLAGIQEVIVVKLGNFLDIVHFFAYCNHVLLVLKRGYETGQAATQIKIKEPR